MAPIKVGFIGLSTKGWAKGAHLPYLKASPEYEVVAVCNSSVESAEKAIEVFELSGAKGYGDPEKLAKDPNVELVVCSVRVDHHHATIAPSLEAGKDVYVEWPLGRSLADAEDLLELKNSSGVKNAIVGLQARQAPLIHKTKEIIESGKIGKVLSSNWNAQAGHGGATIQEGYQYLVNRERGGNLLTIHFGHAIDYIQYVLGYGFQTPPKTLLANSRPLITLLDSDNKVLQKDFPSTGDDTIYLHGNLSSNIPLSCTLRGGAPFKGTPGLDWRIYGEKGEIRITATGPFIQIGYPDMKLEVHDFESDTVEEVEVVSEAVDGIDGIPGGNVARVYRALKGLREGKEGLVEGGGLCGFEDAVERHRVLEGIYRENGILESEFKV